ncbi:CoA ligase [Bipolaris maydis]|nr:CoA ligase [Bipolaris maydis]KAJ6202945.1 CoA ligase [Bipolaris maydis]
MPITSPLPSVTLPEIDLFSFIFGRTDRKWSDDLVIIKDADDLQRQYTFKEVEQHAVTFGAGIQTTLNIQKGDMIAVISQNDIDVLPILFGTASIGAIFSPMNPGHAPEELVKQLRTAEAKLVVTHFTNVHAIARVCAQVGIPESHILTLGSQTELNGPIQHWKSICRATDKRHFQPAKISPKQDPALLLYSSGTTGVPKGVILTHYNLISNLLIRVAAEWGQVRPEGGLGKVKNLPDAPPSGDKALMVIPFVHAYGLSYVLLTNLYGGIPVVVMSKFDFTKWCQTIEKEKITIVTMIPTMALRLIRERIPYDLSSVRMAVIGGAATPSEIQQTLADRYNMPSRLGYGLTEAGPGITGKRWCDWNDELGSGDPLYPNVVAKILPFEDGAGAGPISDEELPQGTAGEIYIHSPGNFKGYWKNPQATKEVLSSDGWLRTGDVGYFDEKARFIPTDRAKELIKYKGFQVAPAELEGLLATHELVEDVAVVGAWSEEIGSEIPVAFVVPKGGLAATKSWDDVAIMTWLSEKVVKYKNLKGLKFIQAIPRNANGKVLRKVVKEMAMKEFSSKNRVLPAKL